MTEDEQPRTRRRRRLSPVALVIVITQLVVAVLTAGTVYAFVRQLDDELAPGIVIPHAAGDKKDDGPKTPLNILVMGQDDRSCAGCDIDSEAGGGGSDTTMLLHLSADRKEAYGVSLPRDAIVDRPDCVDPDGKTIAGEDDVMFNDAYTVAGPTCTVQMVEDLTGVFIDHFIVLDFAGFKDMVDAVGGVQVCIPKEVDDPKHQIFLDAGTQELDGAQALDYVRERYTLSVTGDIGRMKRQQAFVASMVNKVMSANTLSQPLKVRDFLKAVLGSIQVDDDLDSVRQLANLAVQFRQTGLSDIQFVTVPFEEYPEDPNRLQWTADADKLWDRISNDRSLGRTFSDGSISAAEPPTSASPSEGASGSASGSPSGSASASPDEEEAAQEQAAARTAAGLCA